MTTPYAQSRGRVLVNEDGTALGTAAPLAIQGTVASAAVSTANPVLAGAVVEAAPSATGLADGDLVNLKADGRGYLQATLGVGGGTAMSSAAMGDAASNTPTRLQVASFAVFYNGTTWDRMRGDAANGLLMQQAGAEYETVAASQTDQMLGATGAVGDYLRGLLIIPATTTPGEVSIEDGSTNMIVFAGGASSVSELRPIWIPLGIKSVSGGWEITTGANVSVLACGNFT